MVRTMSAASTPAAVLHTLGFQSARPFASDTRRSGFAVLLPTPLHPHLVRVNVRADGHCGAYVLAIFHFALQRRVSSQAQIRRRVYRLAHSLASDALPRSLGQEFATTFGKIAREAYLNDTELVLFLQAQNLSTHILSTSVPSRELLVQSFRVASPVGHAFLIFSHGCHWEILARSANTGFTPFWTVRGGDALLSRIGATGAHLRDGVPPRTTYTTIVHGVPLFRIDAKDRRWV